MITVIVADDRALSRTGIRLILSGEADIRVVAEASTADPLPDMLDATAATVVLLDLSTPGPPRPELIRHIRRRTRVILLGASPGHPGVQEALRAGAAGALSRDEPAEALIAAIRKVAAGGRYVSRSLSRRSPPPIPGLSAREFEVLRLFGTGRNNREVAEALGLSHKTVSTYRARLFKKLGLRSLPDVVRFAVERGHGY